MCVLILLSYTSIWSYTKMLFVIQNCVKSLPRKDENDRTCKRIVVKIKAIALMNRRFRKGMKSLSRGKSKLHVFTQSSLCFDLFIFSLNLLALSALVLAFQLFTCELCLQISGMRIPRIRLRQIDFFLNTFADATASPLWRLVT